jgi:hypothetical protein
MSLLNPDYYDNLDPDFYMYLNPELRVDHSITTVEQAYQHYSQLTVKPHVPNRRELLDQFNHKVYYHFYNSNILQDDYIVDEVRSNLVEDIERLTVIHYFRHGDQFQFRHHAIDSNFNPYLYKVMHKITADLTDEELYFDYLDRKDSGEEAVVVGNINELTFHVACNLTLAIDNLVVDDTLTVKENLVVQKDAYILGNLGTDSTGIIVEGGSVVVDDRYGRTDRIFMYNRLSSNSLALGDQLILATTDSSACNVLQISGGNMNVAQDLVVNSNLFVEQSAIIGSGLTVDPAYSLQTEKNIMVNGTETTSDKRLKTDIIDVDGDRCVEMIRNIKIKEYHRVNDARNKKQVGVIAQEVVEQIPNIVSTKVSFLPMFMKPSLALSENRLSAIGTTEIEVNDTLLLIDQNKKKHYVNVDHVDDKHIQILSKSLQKGQTYTIYGKEVNDSMSVDYTQLFCYLLAAVQTLIKKHETIN